MCYIRITIINVLMHFKLHTHIVLMNAVEKLCHNVDNAF